MPGRPCRMSSARSARAVGLISLIRGPRGVVRGSAPEEEKVVGWSSSVHRGTGSGRGASGTAPTVVTRRVSRLAALAPQPSTLRENPMDIVLIAGLWLDGSAWDDVLPELEALGHRGIAVTLPGQGDGTASATYDDQAAAVVAAVDAAEGQPFVVGHSAASTLAWVAADQRPEGVTGVALIGGFPTTEGGAYADFFEPTGDGVPFPGWEPFAGPDSDDMSPELKAEVAAGSHPVPVGVTKGIGHWPMFTQPKALTVLIDEATKRGRS